MNKLILPLPDIMKRMETQVVQFGDDDWPGMFLRGDDAMSVAFCLHACANQLEQGLEISEVSIAVMRGLANMMKQCDVILDDRKGK